MSKHNPYQNGRGGMPPDPRRRQPTFSEGPRKSTGSSAQKRDATDPLYNTTDFSLFRDSTTKKKRAQQERAANARAQAEKLEEFSTPAKKRSAGRASARPATKKPSLAAKYRNRRRGAAVLIALLLLAGGLYWSANLLLKIERFDVVGECIYTEEQLLEAVGLQVGDSMLGFSAGTIQTQVQKDLPYIEVLEIRRRLPGTVQLYVTAAAETYYVALNEQFYIMSISLKMLRTDSQAPPGLMQIVGIAPAEGVIGEPLTIENAEKAETLALLLKEISGVEAGRIHQVDVDDLANMSFMWEGRIRVILGGRNELDKKIAYALLLLLDETGKAPPATFRGSIDVSSYPEDKQALVAPE